MGVLDMFCCGGDKNMKTKHIEYTHYSNSPVTTSATSSTTINGFLSSGHDASTSTTPPRYQ
jgi:hypothetical protein